MNSLAVIVLAFLTTFSAAKPSGIWTDQGHAAVVNVPFTLVGISGGIGPNSASGSSESVNEHGAIGPNGEHNAPNYHGDAAPIVAPEIHRENVAPAVHEGTVTTPAVVQHSAAVVAPVANAAIIESASHANIWSAPTVVQHSAAVLRPVTYSAIVVPEAHGVLETGHGAHWY